MTALRGVILHPTSLRNRWGIGSLGPEAREALNWLRDAKLNIWQMLPLNPPALNGSPYDSTSAFALSPYLISLDDLIEEGWLLNSELPDEVDSPCVDYRGLSRQHRNALHAAAQRVAETIDLTLFKRQCSWLDDWTLFTTLQQTMGLEWTTWPEPIRDRNPHALERFKGELHSEIEREVAIQWLAAASWRRFADHARLVGVELWGDLPIFVSRLSADVWRHRKLFTLNKKGAPSQISGVPPDLYSADGQKWGHPLYDVKEHRAQDYKWWLERVGALSAMVSKFRLDHFRGLVSMWSIDPKSETAKDGLWTEGLGQPLLDAIAGQHGHLPIYAEDLGFITKPVQRLRDSNAIPGLAVLQFGFERDCPAPHHPNHHDDTVIVITGSHDNDTALGWFESLSTSQQRRLHNVIEGAGLMHLPMPDATTALAYRSGAYAALVPMQDLLSLGSDARLNTPGTEEGNWRWRLDVDALTAETAAHIASLAE